MGAATGSGIGDQSVTGPPPGVDDAVRGRRYDLVAAIAGLLFTALILGSFFTPETPSATDSAEEIARAMTADRAGHQVSLFLGFLADVAFFVFLAGVWSRLRRHEGSGGMAAALFGLAGAAFAATILVSGGLYLAMLTAADELSDPAALPAMAVLNDWVGSGTVPAGVAMFLGAAFAGLSTRALPVWLGWLAAAVAFLLIVSMAGVFRSGTDEGVIELAGFGGFLLFLVWTPATSIVLLMRARRGAHASV